MRERVLPVLAVVLAILAIWYVAAGLGTVAVAAIVWAAIRSKAEEPLTSPSTE